MSSRFLPCLVSAWIFMMAASGASAQSSDPFLSALLDSPWSWIRPDNKTTGTVTFTPGGRVTQNTPGNRWQGAWERTGPLTVVITHDRKYKWTLQFQADLMSYSGRSGRQHDPVRGGRQQTLPPGLLPPPQPVAAPRVPPAPAPLPPVLTDSRLSRLEVIQQQGPNATEWALMPLHQAVPADIRKNLTLLREDLLDEGRQNPRSTPEAYAIASGYCHKILALLSQREIARVNAGYSAALADADRRTSTQALDARRNYMMSWPQFDREQSQRTALDQQNQARIAVANEAQKVAWATKSARLRANLDTRYRTFRSAMRK